MAITVAVGSLPLAIAAVAVVVVVVVLVGFAWLLLNDVTRRGERFRWGKADLQVDFYR